VHRWEQDYIAAVKATKVAGKTKGEYGAIDVKAVRAHMRAHGGDDGTTPRKSTAKPRERVPTPKSGTGGPPKPPASIRPVAGSPEDRYPDLPDGAPAPLRPSDISSLTDDDLAHIIEGQSASWTMTAIAPARGVAIRALYDGVVIEVPVRQIGKAWEVSSAYPISGDGVYRNIAGQRRPVPLNVDDLTRRLRS
jgi:hypothetical protein